MSNFNASIAVTELLMKTVENAAKDLARRCIEECATRHGFLASDEIRTLGLENLTLMRKEMAKKKKSVVVKKEVVKKSKLPMPFEKSGVSEMGCQGLSYNRGLFTQCEKKRMDNGKFCSGCQTEADNNTSGCPDCGTVEERLSKELYEFKDPKGRSPVSYVKVLEKLKISQEKALSEAGKLNMALSDEHFVVAVAVKEKKSETIRGRPKKSVGAVTVDDVTDLFAKLTTENPNSPIDEEEETEKPVKNSKKAKLSEEDKEAKKAALEAERVAKKLEREAKLAAEKEEKEAKRKAELEEKKKEREAKIASEKEEREAKRLKEKEEKEAKKKQEKEEKEKETKKPKGKQAVVAQPAAETQAVAPQTPTKVSVSRIQIGGKQYLKSSSNILYDPNTKEEVGLWDPESKTIKELPEDDDDEVEEEDYESDDN